MSAKKREDPISDESEKEEEPLVNMSQRKLKVSTSKGGLGKRSKSTIIKTPVMDQPKTTVKKDGKKFNSNPTDESLKHKTKRKKSYKMIETSREFKQRPLTSRREFIPIASKEVPKKEKEKMTLKLDKAGLKDDKKGTGSKIKPSAPKKSSKPASAR